MDLATPMVEILMRKVCSLIKEEFLLTYGVKKDVEKLESTLSMIQATLREAEGKQPKKETWKDWLEKLRDAAYDAEDILDAFSTQVQLWKRERPVRSCPPFLASRFFFQNDIAHKIRNMVTRLDEIDKEKNQYVERTFEEGRERETQTLPQETICLVGSEVVGRKGEKKRIVKSLISGQSDEEGKISVIPIIGMGGLGKTTLAQLVYNDENIKKHFEHRIWVSVPVDFDLSRILNEILAHDKKMKHDNKLSLNQLGNHFQQYLGGDKFLLVLDGVWTENYSDGTRKFMDKWDQLKNILKQGKMGSKVLVTSRSIEVSNIMRTHTAHMLDDLSENECWSLFQNHAFPRPANLPSQTRGELEKIGRAIIQKCKNLPLAVKMIACLLRGNYDAEEWQMILGNDKWEGLTNNGEILSALKLSYDYLPAHLKPCFAFCSLFPKAYLFDKKELVKLWIAEGFIPSSNGQQITGIKPFDDLLSRSFFQPFPDTDSKDKYRMHDLIHDVAQHVSSSHGYTIEDTNQGNVSKESRHVSIFCEDRKQPALDSRVIDSKKLRTLLFPRQYLKDFGQLLDQMFQSIKYVRVLDLSSSTISQLPTSIEKLSLLRYLDLSKTEIRMLPESICNLWNLQTLKLLGCVSLSQLPRDLGKLIHLMHLELDEIFWYNATAMPPRMGNLTSLHNLHVFQIGSTKDGYGIEELKGMKYLTGALHISKLENAANAKEANLREKTCLDRLVLEWSNRVAVSDDKPAKETAQLEDLQPHPKLNELQIYHYRGTGLPIWMTNGHLQNLVALSLKHCTNCSVLLLGRLPHLRQLCIKGMQELEDWPKEELPSLVRLKISNCPKLRELPEAKFGSLVILKISDCPELRKLPSSFPHLGVLKIKKCDSLKALARTPSVRSLILVNNPVLEDWPQDSYDYEDQHQDSYDDEDRQQDSYDYEDQHQDSYDAEDRHQDSYDDEDGHQDFYDDEDGHQESYDDEDGHQDSYDDEDGHQDFYDDEDGHQESYDDEDGHQDSYDDEDGHQDFYDDEDGHQDSYDYGEWHQDYYDYAGWKIICCPKLQAWPQVCFGPVKLEIRGCELLTAFPDSGDFEWLQHLALDDVRILVKAIPVASSLISLVISNISNATSLPKWPHLQRLKALYIHHCKGLVSLSQEAAPLQRLTSLQLLSIQSCLELVSLPAEGLPISLECLIIGSCPNVKSLGPKDVLKSLTSLKDLYIEDCPKLKCLPEEGVSTSLQHLVIQGCPLLMEQCREEGGGQDWPKIRHIPDLEISSINVSSTFRDSVPWYRRFACCQGIEVRETGQSSKQPNNLPGSTLAEGQNSKGKKVLGEASTSA